MACGLCKLDANSGALMLEESRTNSCGPLGQYVVELRFRSVVLEKPKHLSVWWKVLSYLDMCLINKFTLLWGHKNSITWVEFMSLMAESSCTHAITKTGLNIPTTLIVHYE
jgi:hypothetical protein